MKLLNYWENYWDSTHATLAVKAKVITSELLKTAADGRTWRIGTTDELVVYSMVMLQLIADLKEE